MDADKDDQPDAFLSGYMVRIFAASLLGNGLFGWNPNLTAGTLTLLQVLHAPFFLFYLNFQ